MEILEVEKQKLKVQIITQIRISTSSKFLIIKYYFRLIASIL